MQWEKSSSAIRLSRNAGTRAPTFNYDMYQSMTYLGSQNLAIQKKGLLTTASRVSKKAVFRLYLRYETDRPASASTHYEVSDIRKSLSQLQAEVGVSNGDESFSPLSQRLSMQVHRTELGHHPVHVPPGRYHTGTGFELRNDP
jgi:hypothetical protein